MLLSIEQLEESSKRFSSTHEGPVRDSHDLSPEAFVQDVSPEAIEGNMLTSDENMRKRISMLEASSPEPLDFALERAIGRNDSVYTNFVELLISAKHKVGRVACKNGIKTLGCATGFMVSDRLMLTNWHVFKTKDKVCDSEIQFFYELDPSGNPPGSYVCFRLQPDVFYYSNQALDYCFVAVNPVDVTGQTRLSEIGYLYLDPGLGKLGNEGEEALNIIHHPDGDFKQLSIRENLFRKITPTSIWYESDTAPGSSGSPVFNDQWQVVGLHHMGVAKKNDAGEYVDKDDRVIPMVNKKIDESKVVWIANEGIRVSVILKDIFAVYPDSEIVNTLKIRPPSGSNKSTTVAGSEDDPGDLKNKPLNTSAMSQNNPEGNVNISFPGSLIEKNGIINIHIDNYGSKEPARTGLSGTAIMSDEELEIKKAEAELDLSKCRGYNSSFLGNGIDIPFPQPRKKLKKFIARVNGTDSLVLKYYYYSVMLHTVRMMPVISAVNVDGDLKKRQDDSERKDTWLRDPRVDYDVQLDDAYYKRSGFDRGHMSRREDANWGRTAEDAKRNADLTCMYTNACPQVAALNQSKNEGLWGKLEKIVLEEGATNEGARTRKISVFNGPIFEETDPVYKGIQVPMAFYKIVLWLTDDKELRATAFVLRQNDLVGDIDFEQLDIDQNVDFKEHQYSIAKLATETGLDFSDIVDHDTFSNDGDFKEISEVELKAHIAENRKTKR